MTEAPRSGGNTGVPAAGDTPAAALITALAAESLTLAAAESCTAGLVADRIARVPGASRVFWGSFVTYSIDAKVKLLGIERELIDRCGAVSRETACAMADGALEKSGAHVAVSVTGLAGPDGDGSGQPVGTVWIGFARQGFSAEALCRHYDGDRSAIRNAAAGDAISILLNRLTLAE
ncbi:CinA domain protein [Treponema primitia ZAS-2]|uniref:CinA domain protein n=1 Tax=Treponema primitia (strain ATCC BAA-887 / DSM 12427 / ZAS-2) TaxID=545694 RepID=F5YKI4_TREPZ|nr:nicotinamide-nucleotide amidohydrolase family protein [Treponema primitia]AEF83530.1 CinA domain protein [Treponema primitia ZAS-2]